MKRIRILSADELEVLTLSTTTNGLSLKDYLHRRFCGCTFEALASNEFRIVNGAAYYLPADGFIVFE